MRFAMNGWVIASRALFAGFLLAAALNMLHVHGGFLTNHLADLVVPAMLYVESRRPNNPGRATSILRFVGRTPERAAVVLFLASTATEVSQYFWPHGLFRGTFDPLDVVAYAVGVGACYVAEKRLMHDRQGVEVNGAAT